MTTNIQLLRSSIANKRPAPATLLEGQAAVNLNTTEPGLYFKLSSGALTKVGPTCVNSNGVAPNATPAGSSGNAVGETWLDSRTTLSSPVLKVYDGSVWRTSSGFLVDDATGDYSLAKGVTVRNLISNGTGPNSYVKLNSGPTTDQNSITAAAGMVRYDTTSNEYMGYYGGVSAGWRILSPTAPATVVASNVAPASPNVGDLWYNTSSSVGGGRTYVYYDDGLTDQWVDVAPSILDSGYLETTGGTMVGTLNMNANILPTVDSTFDLGSATLRFANVYTGDLHLKNDRGDWTVVEEDDFLSLRNNKSGKVFRLLMEEVG